MKRKLASALLKYRVPILVLLVVITAVAGVFAFRVRFDNTIEIWFLEGDEGLALYRKFLDLFESDELVVVALAPGDVFTNRSLEYVDRLTKRLEDVDHVIRVTSITNVEVPRAVPGGVEIGPLVKELPSKAAELAVIRRQAMANRMLSGTLLSKNGDATAIVAQIEHIQGQFDYKIEMLKEIRSILADESRGLPELHLAGAPVIDDAFFRYTERDFRTFMPLVFVLTTAVILAIFRRPSAVLLPLAVVNMSLVWVFGLMGILGLKINVVSTIIAPLLMAVGIADSIHVLSQYYEDLEEGMSKKEAIVTAFHNVFTPCLMTSLTTAVGLLSLLTSELTPLRQFGAIAALGVTFAFVNTMLLIPVMLSWLKPPPGRFLQKHRTGSLARVLVAMGRFGTRHAFLIVAVSALLLVGSGYALTRLVVGTNSMDYFKENDPVRRAIDFVDNHIGGTVSLEFLLEGEREGTFEEPAILSKMDAMESFLNKLPGVTGSLSLVDQLKEMNRVMWGGDESHCRLPPTRELTAQYLLLMEGTDDLDQMVQDGYRVARISSRVRMEDSRALSGKVGEIEEYLADNFTNGVTAKATGLVKLMHDMEAYLLSSQIRSFSVAFVVIVLMMAAMLKSIRLGLFAMIPNLLPVLMTLGIMGAVGIHLDVGTVTIASIILGLVVDDTIHFLYRFREEIGTRGEALSAIQATIESVGKPIFSTSIILALGFWVLCLASFLPNIHFGFLSGVSILIALVADLVLMPAAITLFKPRFDVGSRRRPAA